MTRKEAKQALEEARRNKPGVQKLIYSQAVWDAKEKYISGALTQRGEGLAGMWTSLADEIFELVAYGVLSKYDWGNYFSENRPKMGPGSDAEAVFRSRDPDQTNTCRNGLAKLIAIIP